jgi:hypothetical protein
VSRCVQAVDPAAASQSAPASEGECAQDDPAADHDALPHRQAIEGPVLVPRQELGRCHGSGLRRHLEPADRDRVHHGARHGLRLPAAHHHAGHGEPLRAGRPVLVPRQELGRCHGSGLRRHLLHDPGGVHAGSVLGGPIMNLLIAIVCITVLVTGFGSQQPTTTLAISGAQPRRVRRSRGVVLRALPLGGRCGLGGGGRIACRCGSAS